MIKRLNWINIIFLNLFLFGFLIKGFTFIKYIGLYGSILIFFVRLYLDKEIINNFKNYYIQNKTIILSFFAFIGAILISIIFSYSNYQPSLREFRISFLNISIFTIITLSLKKDYLKFFIYTILLASIYDVFFYFYEYIKNNPYLNFSVRLSRDFSDKIELLFPFLLGGLVILKNKFLKFFIIIILVISIFELILTGARGAWASIIIELILFFSLLLYFNKNYLKKVVIWFIGSCLFICLGSLYIYKHSSLIQSKVNQGLNTSGRDKIVETRLPIFLKKGNFLVGIGGPGNYQYVKFLNDNNAPKIYGCQSGKIFRYWADEPFLLQIFYKEGLFGLLSFIILSCVFLFQMFKSMKENFYETQIYILSIFTSFIGVYFIRGLVEGRDFKYLVLFLVLYIAFKEKNENSLYLS